MFFNAYIILEDNQILKEKKKFDTFLFSKKGTFSTNKRCPALIVKKKFGVSHWNLVLLNVFDLKSTDFPFKMS